MLIVDIYIYICIYISSYNDHPMSPLINNYNTIPSPKYAYMQDAFLVLMVILCRCSPTGIITTLVGTSRVIPHTHLHFK